MAAAGAAIIRTIAGIAAEISVSAVTFLTLVPIAYRVTDCDGKVNANIVPFPKIILNQANTGV
jgi:hypothetical protein